MTGSIKPGSDPRLLVNIFGGKNVISKRTRIPTREVAAAILMTLARHKEGHHEFCCNFFYDYDSDFLSDVCDKLNAHHLTVNQIISKVKRACKKLEEAGILAGNMVCCHAEYLGEPRMLKKYEFADYSYALRLAPELHPHYKPMGKVEVELDYLLSKAFRDQEN